jgi:hypothetical protein
VEGELHSPSSCETGTSRAAVAYRIGRYLSMLIVAEIDEIERIRTARHLCAWAA